MIAKVILVGLFLTTLSEALPLSKNEVSNLKSKLNLFKTNMVKNDFVDETIDQNESEINEIDQDEDEPENEDHSENDIIEDDPDDPRIKTQPGQVLRTRAVRRAEARSKKRELLEKS